jgi:hypothetical protein
LYFSTCRSLGLVLGELSPALVGPDTGTRLLEFSARHPGLGQTQYLECRLGPGKSRQVDLLISAGTALDRASLGRALSARPGEPPELWPLRRFVAGWLSPASPLHRGVPVAWLEFDHLERDENPVASIGVCVAPAYLDPFVALPPQASRDALPVVVEALRVIRRHEVSSEEEIALQRCFDRLPAGARWIHLSVMAGREPAELKLYGIFPGRTVLGYLAEIGWGPLPGFEDLLARHCTPERTGGVVYLDLPITGTGLMAPTGPRAGLGVVFAQQQLRASAERDPRRTPLLDGLVAEGLCTAEEREALLRWPASQSLDLPGGHLDRWFDVKLVHHPLRGLAAKAYLGFAARIA